MRVSVSYRGKPEEIEIEDATSLAVFKEHLASLTQIVPENQKLVYKGSATWMQMMKTNEVSAEKVTIAQAGIEDGMKIMLMGVASPDIAQIARGDRKIAILRKRDAEVASGKTSRPSSTSNSAIGRPSTSSYAFQQIEPLMHPIFASPPLPPSLSPEAARNYLLRLGNDPSIRNLMTRHRLSVGLLTELPPLPDDPETSARLLGLNENAGQRILLRLRTDDIEGWRNYNTVRTTLVHELTHNTIGPHNDDFHALNRQYLSEVEDHDRVEEANRRQKVGSEVYGGKQWSPGSALTRYAPTSGPGISNSNANSHRLSSGQPSNSTALPIKDLSDPAARRNVMREAAEARLLKDQRTISSSCAADVPKQSEGMASEEMECATNGPDPGGVARVGRDVVIPAPTNENGHASPSSSSDE